MLFCVLLLLRYPGFVCLCGYLLHDRIVARCAPGTERIHFGDWLNFRSSTPSAFLEASSVYHIRCWVSRGSQPEQVKMQNYLLKHMMHASDDEMVKGKSMTRLMYI